jgi:hypothetical protein
MAEAATPIDMSELPQPPVPSDLDLRDFRWMKLDLTALFNSDFNQTLDDAAWRAGVTLWGKAWHQVPAGSLPNDESKLCHLAGLGRDTATWSRIRETALHKFYLCGDGRLYHPIVCRHALDADAERKRYAARLARDRKRKRGGIPAENGAVPTEFHMENPIEGEGEGEGNIKRTPIGVPKSPPVLNSGFQESGRAQANEARSRLGEADCLRIAAKLRTGRHRVVDDPGADVAAVLPAVLRGDG